MDNKTTHHDICSTFAIHEPLVKKARKNLPSNEVAERLSELFKILGDQTRVMILSALAHTELCVCDLCVLLDMQQSAISHQLKVLKLSRLVKSRKEGRMVFYSMDDQHVEDIFRFGIEHISEPTGITASGKKR